MLKLTSVYALILVGGFGTRLRPLTVRVDLRLRHLSVCGTRRHVTTTPTDDFGPSTDYAAFVAQASRRVL